MLILHVITGLQRGGAETVLFRLIAETSSTVNHVVVSLTEAGVYGARLASAGITVRELHMQRPLRSIGGLSELRRMIKRINPDVVQTWMYHSDLLGGIAAYATGSPVVWGIRNSNLDARGTKRLTHWVRRACAALSEHMPRRIVSCSLRAVQIHQDMGYVRERWTVIPNGYDLTEFSISRDRRENMRTSLGVGTSEVLLGCVARWDPQKDHANLFRALRILADRGLSVRCVLAGDGMTDGNGQLAALATSYGVSSLLLCLGAVDAINSVYSAVDFSVLASAYGEAFPNVLAESMACGTLCIATDVGDASEIVGDSGWIVPPRDSVALAEAIASAISLVGTADLSDISGRARARIANAFSMRVMADSYLAVWSEARRGL